MNEESLQKVWELHIKLAARRWDSLEGSFRRSIHGDLLRQVADMAGAGDIDMRDSVAEIQLTLQRSGVGQSITIGNEAHQAVQRFINS